MGNANQSGAKDNGSQPGAKDNGSLSGAKELLSQTCEKTDEANKVKEILSKCPQLLNEVESKSHKCNPTIIFALGLKWKWLDCIDDRVPLQPC